MASLRELDETIPAYFTMSNKKLLIIARVREESIYFYDILDRHTTIVLLTEPDCYAIKYLFLEFMNDIGATVIDLREKETVDPLYKISEKSQKIISSLIYDYKYEQIITHPKYTKTNDPQNREIYDLVTKLVHEVESDNHYTYNKIPSNVSPILPSKIKKGVLELYCRSHSKNNNIDQNMLQKYINISSRIYGLRKLINSDS